MSTRSSIWYGESEGKSVHIYWELAEREQIPKFAAPVYICVTDEVTFHETALRLPKEIAESLVESLNPWFRHDVL